MMKSGEQKHFFWKHRQLFGLLLLALVPFLVNAIFIYADEEELCIHHPNHTEDCGYTDDGQPCNFLCPFCINDWQWDDPEQTLVWNADAKQWGLGLPGASEQMPVTPEVLAPLLPQTITAQTAVGPSTVPLVWDFSAFPAEGLWQDTYTITADTAADYLLTDNAPELSVLLDMGGGETYAPYPALALNEWTWEILNKYGTDAVLTLNIYNIKDKATLLTALQQNLPQRIFGYSYGDKSIDLTADDPFTLKEYNSTTNISWGWLKVDWSKLGTQIDAKEIVLNDGFSFTLEADKPTRTGAKYYINDNNGNNLDTIPITVLLKYIDPNARFVNDWSFISRDNITITKKPDGTFHIDLLTADISNRDTLIQTLKSTLPNNISAWGYVSDGILEQAGFKRTEVKNEHQYGEIEISWDNISTVLPSTPQYDTEYTFAAKTVVNNSGYRIVVNDKTDPDNKPNSDANPDLMSITVTLKELTLPTVDAVKTPNVTVNLFDYWVKTENPSEATGGDILTKSDWHIRPNADSKGNPLEGLTNTPFSTVEDWNKGINEGHLLLFGDGLIHAGLWNKGAGESTIYGNKHAGMENIVQKTLNSEGYPVINTAAAREKLADYEQVRDYQLAGSHIGNIGTSDNGASYDGKNIQNLSNDVISLWEKATGQEIETGTESLQYLFDPTAQNDYKKSFTNVTGLFQLDNQGYYYYNMRENFAEFEGYKTENSDGHFILYNAPATTRTDGEKSIGNFFPFNKGSEVFNGVDEKDNLTSSIDCARNSMNHHLGMTVTVDFRQPANGQINTSGGQEPMTFGFSGDDDVWVFIDDVLVLDLGGTHSEIYGTIDFSTGDVYIGRAFGTNGIPKDPENPANMVTHTTLKKCFEAAEHPSKDSDWTGNTFASNTEHTLKMFYLERGNYDSSLALRFNLQPLLYQQILKVDQNGQPVPNVEFELYEAERTNDTTEIQCLYTDTNVNNNEVFYVRQNGGKKLVTLKTDEKGAAQFQTEDGFFNFADRGEQYYILKETNAPEGYRKQPVDIVLHYEPKTAMLSVANRWTTGAYACSFSNITTNSLHYGIAQNNLNKPIEPDMSASIDKTKLKNSLIIAVPMLRNQTNNTWLPLYGSNLSGFNTVSYENNNWQNAILQAALSQAYTPNTASWHLSWNADTNSLYGQLYDLPGLANRYLLNNSNGDMQSVFIIISEEALENLGLFNNNGNGSPKGDANKVYTALRDYVQTNGVQSAMESILKDNGFRLLSVKEFNRDFRSMIYIPNERRELRVLKIDQDGKPLSGAEFTLFSDPECKNVVAKGSTNEKGLLIFSPEAPTNPNSGQAQMIWANRNNSKYYLKETAAPTGCDINNTVIPIVVGTYSIYADAGQANDGVTVMASVGKLTQTMRQYAMDSEVDITLQDITAFMQTQPSGNTNLPPDKWQDVKLEGTDVVRSMNLHFGKNTKTIYGDVDYGLHDQDGGQNFAPFFVSDVGFVRARVQQNWAALTGGQYDNPKTYVNKDNLGETDLTNLFSLLNMVVVTDQTEVDTNTGKLTISKTVQGENLSKADYNQLFSFKIDFMDKDGIPLNGSFEYYFYGEDKTGTVTSGGTLLLHHDEAVTILGLPIGTKYTVTEAAEDGWHILQPADGTATGAITKESNAEARFINSRNPDEKPKPGNLSVQKTVSGNAADQNKEFHFTVRLGDDTINGEYGDMQFTNGVAEFTLKHNEQKKATGLPAGTRYTVTETEANQNGYTTTTEKANGSITAGGTSEVKFTNQANKPGQYGSLFVRKTVSGNAVDLNKEFHFTVRLGDDTINGEYGDMQFTNGVAEFTLKHNEQKKAVGLPAGTSYTVTETEANQDGYTTTSSRASGSIAADGTIEVSFNNHKDGTTPPPPTNPNPKPEPKPEDPGNEPEPKPEPKPEEPKPEEPKPELPPEPTPEQQPEPTPEQNPEYPTELPDPNDPKSPETITIYENGVPKTYIKVFDPETNEYIYLLDEEVPLFGPNHIPPTGDSAHLALEFAICLLTLLGLACLLRKPGHNKK